MKASLAILGQSTKTKCLSICIFVKSPNLMPVECTTPMVKSFVIFTADYNISTRDEAILLE